MKALSKTKWSVARKNIFQRFYLRIRKILSQNTLISVIEELRIKLDNNFVAGVVPTDLSKAFDCIPHHLLIAKLSAYNFSDEAWSYIYSYLTNRRLRPYKQHAQSGRDYDFRFPTGIYFFGVDSFQLISK